MDQYVKNDNFSESSDFENETKHFLQIDKKELQDIELQFKDKTKGINLRVR
jgi:hypothetical protein